MTRTPMLAAIAALALAAGCGGESGPVAGALDIAVSSAPAGARAVLLRVVGGPVTAAAAPAGQPQRVFLSVSGDTAKIAVIAPTGVTLGTGPLVRLTVPDTRRAGDYVVTAVQASNASYQLIGPSFTFTVQSP